MLHESVVPGYALSFIVDPWWLLDIQISKRNKTTVMKQFNNISKKVQGSKIGPKRIKRCMKILELAKRDCMLILQKRKTLMNRSAIIGLWSHKLGWGTKPLNTDGNMKLLFNPVMACRNHGGYDYDKSCQAFLIRTGYGHSSSA